MGFQNRDYARSGNASWNGVTDAPVCRAILIATIVVFLLQIFSARDAVVQHRPDMFQSLREAAERHSPESSDEIELLIPMPVRTRVSAIQELLQLETAKVLSGQVWRVFTMAFCHDRYTIWHIFMNMLVLWWFGPTLETMYGSKEFLLFYLGGALAASLAYIGLDVLTGDPVPAIGASGAVMAVTVLFAFHFPTHIIRVFYIIPIEIRWLVWIYALVDLHPVLLELSGSSFSDGIAHAAHLGGLAFGFLYSRRRWYLSPFFTLSWLPQSLRSSSWFTSNRPGPFSAQPPMPPREIVPFPRARVAREADSSQLDDLLDKIRVSGQESLTEEEIQTLIRESERLRNESERLKNRR